MAAVLGVVLLAQVTMAQLDVEPVEEPPTIEEEAPAPAAPSSFTGMITAYCLTGTMANGQRVHSGAVAAVGIPLGTTVVIEGLGTYTVSDRGHLAPGQFDVWMPSCDAARQWGVRYRQVTILR